MMSDNLSHDVDVTDPFENWEEWDKQRILTAGNILAQTLEFDVDDIFLTCMIALSEANAHSLVKDLQHTKELYDLILEEECSLNNGDSYNEERF